MIRRIHHRQGLTFSLGSGHKGALVYAITTASNVLMIGTYYRKVYHSYCGLLTMSCRSPLVMRDFKGNSNWFAYILPSTLVIVSSYINHVHLIDYDHSAPQSCRFYAQSSLQNSLQDQAFCFCSESLLVCCADRRLRQRLNYISNTRI